MLKDGDRLLLGLSGGKDSLSLLHILLEFQKKLPIKFDIEVSRISWCFQTTDDQDHLSQRFSRWYQLFHDRSVQLIPWPLHLVRFVAIYLLVWIALKNMLKSFLTFDTTQPRFFLQYSIQTFRSFTAYSIRWITRIEIPFHSRRNRRTCSYLGKRWSHSFFALCLLCEDETWKPLCLCKK